MRAPPSLRRDGARRLDEPNTPRQRSRRSMDLERSERYTGGRGGWPVQSSGGVRYVPVSRPGRRGSSVALSRWLLLPETRRPAARAGEEHPIPTLHDPILPHLWRLSCRKCAGIVPPGQGEDTMNPRLVELLAREGVHRSTIDHRDVSLRKSGPRSLTYRATGSRRSSSSATTRTTGMRSSWCLRPANSISFT